MKKHDFIGVCFVIVCLSFTFVALHNIDNVFNAMNIEQSLMQDSSLILKTGMSDLYTTSCFILFMSNLILVFIIVCLLYEHDNRGTGHSKTGNIYKRTRTN